MSVQLWIHFFTTDSKFLYRKCQVGHSLPPSWGFFALRTHQDVCVNLLFPPHEHYSLIAVGNQHYKCSFPTVHQVSCPSFDSHYLATYFVGYLEDLVFKGPVLPFSQHLTAKALQTFVGSLKLNSNFLFTRTEWNKSYPSVPCCSVVCRCIPSLNGTVRATRVWAYHAFSARIAWASRHAWVPS